MLELKLAGNHLTRTEVERALLRRQARQLQRLEKEDAAWLGEEPLWLVAPHVPRWLEAAWHPEQTAPGCYQVDRRHNFLWIAANELPLQAELIPFLMARSGRALDELAKWAAHFQPIEWVMSMIKYMPMSMPTREKLLQDFALTGDPEIDARQQHMLEVLLDLNPQFKRRLDEQSRLDEVRSMLRRVLVIRQLAPSPTDDARIEACTDLAALERWVERALTAASAAEALA